MKMLANNKSNEHEYDEETFLDIKFGESELSDILIDLLGKNKKVDYKDTRTLYDLSY